MDKAERLSRLDEALLARGIDPSSNSPGGRSDGGRGVGLEDRPSAGSFSDTLRAQFNIPERQEARRRAKGGLIDATKVPDNPYDASHLDHDHDWLGG
jgi:hypothetical protein